MSAAKRGGATSDFVAPLRASLGKATDSRSTRPSYISMENQIQDLEATSCGFYVIAWIKFLHRKKDKITAYRDFIAKFKEDTDYNDAILKKILDGR
jgi:hypothetical protein